MSESYSTYFNSIGTKNTHLVKVWFGHNTVCKAHFMHVSLAFGVVLFAIAKVILFLPAQFCNAVDFTLSLLPTNFKLQYLINYNYSFDFNNSCRF